MHRVIGRVFAHPIGMDGRPLGPGDHGGIGAHRCHLRHRDARHRRTQGAQCTHRGLEGGGHFVVDAVEKPVLHHGDSGSSQASGECCLIIRHGLGRAGRVIGAAPRSDGEEARCVTRRAGQGPHIIGREAERHHPAAWHAGLRRLQAGHTAEAGGQANRAARIRAQRRKEKPRRHPSTRAGGGTAGAVIEAERIMAIAEMAIMASWVLGEFGHVQRAHIHSAGSVETLQHGGGARCHEVAADMAAAGADAALAIIHVLMHHRHAGERRQGGAAGPGAVHAMCLLAGAVRVEANNAVHLAIMLRDARQAGFHQGGRGGFAPGHRIGGLGHREVCQAHGWGSMQARSAASKLLGSSSNTMVPRSASRAAISAAISASPCRAASLGTATPCQRLMASMVGMTILGSLIATCSLPICCW